MVVVQPRDIFLALLLVSCTGKPPSLCVCLSLFLFTRDKTVAFTAEVQERRHHPPSVTAGAATALIPLQEESWMIPCFDPLF